MIIKFKNLGPIESGEIDFNDLKGINLIIGKNNTGKTYLSNFLYSYYQVINLFTKLLVVPSLDLLESNEESELSDDNYIKIENEYKKIIQKEMKKMLLRVFNVRKEIFKNLEIEVNLDEELDRLKKEKNRIRVLFRKENKIIELIKNKNDNKLKFLEEEDSEIDLKNNKLTVRYNKDIYNEKEAKNRTIDVFVCKNLFSNRKYKLFSLPAERSGIALFYKQLLEKRSDILRELELGNSENIEEISRYSEPVNDYVKFLNSISDRSKRLTGLDIYKKLDTELKEILDGEVIIDSEDNIMFRINENKIIDIGMVSSTVKTLTGFYLYLKYFAMERDIIFIDEIELNLHPENQRKIMRLINCLSKQGLKFVISTHSPVITQEMNNMIMFEKCKDKIDDEIIKEYSIDRENYGLRQEDVNVYFLNNKTIKKAEFEEDGIITETFNEVLGEIDNLYQELLFAMEEE